MSQLNSSATSRRDDDEYEFPDELEGIDWSTVGPIEGDEPKPGTTARVSEDGHPPLSTELPPRPGSSSSSYGFPDIETLDEDDLAELDETERLYGLTTGEPVPPAHQPHAHSDRHVGETPENTPSSSAHTLDVISRPIARLPTADDLVFSSNQSSTAHKRKLPSEHEKCSPLKKSKTLPLELTKSSSKGKETARDAPVEDLIQAVYDSFVETCSCPMYVVDEWVHFAVTSLINLHKDVSTSCVSPSYRGAWILTITPVRSHIISCLWVSS